MILAPFPKGPWQLTYVLPFIVCMSTCKPVDYATFLGDLILVLGGYQEVPDDVGPLRMYLDMHIPS